MEKVYGARSGGIGKMYTALSGRKSQGGKKLSKAMPWDSVKKAFSLVMCFGCARKC